MWTCTPLHSYTLTVFPLWNEEIGIYPRLAMRILCSLERRMVGTTGLEPATSRSRTVRSTN